MWHCSELVSDAALLQAVVRCGSLLLNTGAIRHSVRVKIVSLAMQRRTSQTNVAVDQCYVREMQRRTSQTNVAVDQCYVREMRRRINQTNVAADQCFVRAMRRRTSQTNVAADQY